MFTEADSSVSFSDSEPTDIAEYRAVSRLALLALALGAASAAALAVPLLVALGVAGVVTALAALRAIANSQGMLVGRWAALTGLALSLFFGSWVVVMRAAEDRWAYAEARPRAERWIELIRAGRLAEAHQLTIRQEERQPAGTALPAFYETTKKAREDMNNLFHLPAPQKIIEAGGQGTVRFEENVRIDRDRTAAGYSRFITQRFAFEYEENGRPVTLKFLITTAVTVTGIPREARWLIRSVSAA